MKEDELFSFLGCSLTGSTSMLWLKGILQLWTFKPLVAMGTDCKHNSGIFLVHVPHRTIFSSFHSPCSLHQL